MQNDLISRSALIEKFNDTGIQIMFDLPVEEVLGEDVDMDDFAMLVQDAIQAYKNMVIGTIQEQPTAYSVESVERGVKGYFCEVIEKCPEDNVPFEILDYSKDVCNIIRNGGKAGADNAE